MPNLKQWHTLRDGAVNNAEGYGLSDGEYNLLATVPAQHSWGLETSILAPLFANVAVSEETPFFPDDIVQALELLPRPRVLVSSPVHLEALLRADAGSVRIDRILSATAPLSQELARALEEHFGSRVTEIFGCSEAGSLAWRQTATESDWHIMRAFEFAATGDEVKILAAHLPEAVTLNDRIEMIGSKSFRWLGRDQDMINIAGKRGSLAHLNVQLGKIRGVIDGVIFLPDDNAKRLAALVVAPDLDPSAILGELRQFIEPAFLPRPLYKVPVLPRQETGKLARKAILELFNEQRLAAKCADEHPAEGD
jgi:acyl-coenzyme A synthetase/AMP-(fatty) acid ligase